jgi:hypothetical protein
MVDFVFIVAVVGTTLSLHWLQIVFAAAQSRNIARCIRLQAIDRSTRYSLYKIVGIVCEKEASFGELIPPQLEALSIFQFAARCRHESQKNNQNASHSNLSQNHCNLYAQSLATITSQRPLTRTRIRPSSTSMATPQFPSRPFPGLGRTSTVGQQQQQQAPPNANTYQPPGYGGPSNTFNDRGGAGPGQRERQERERAERERIERERREAEERAGALDALSEEQREEINEAVSLAL